MAIGLPIGIGGTLTSFLQPAEARLMVGTLSVSFSALTVGLGSMLAWQAWQSIHGRASRPFQPRWGWLLGVLFILVVLTGQLILKLELLPQLLFPLFHVAAGVLPALLIVALVGRSLGAVTRWRDMVIQTSSGALVSTSLAFALEFAFVLGLLTIAAAAVALRPGGMEEIQALTSQAPELAAGPCGLGAAGPLAAGTRNCVPHLWHRGAPWPKRPSRP